MQIMPMRIATPLSVLYAAERIPANDCTPGVRIDGAHAVGREQRRRCDAGYVIQLARPHTNNIDGGAVQQPVRHQRGTFDPVVGKAAGEGLQSLDDTNDGVWRGVADAYAFAHRVPTRKQFFRERQAASKKCKKFTQRGPPAYSAFTSTRDNMLRSLRAYARACHGGHRDCPSARCGRQIIRR
ncbi:MAG: hypothetical protein WAM90_02805 [Rhodanobacter sp.]